MNISSIGLRFIRLFIIALLLLFASPCYSQNLDINLLKSINLHRPRSLDPEFKAITNTAIPLSFAVPAGMIAAGLIKHDSAFTWQGIQTGVAVLGAGGVAFILKHIVNRKRPYQTYSYIQNYQNDTDPSFPSGHTSLAFATATSLSLQYKRWYVVVPAYAWATAVAYSRLDLGMHYPSDVLGGMLVGAGSAFISYKLQQWWIRKQEHKKGW